MAAAHQTPSSTSLCIFSLNAFGSVENLIREFRPKKIYCSLFRLFDFMESFYTLEQELFVLSGRAAEAESVCHVTNGVAPLLPVALR